MWSKTDALRGSQEKVEAMRARADRREPLFHPNDNDLPDQERATLHREDAAEPQLQTIVKFVEFWGL